jgi:hypothetical protein
LTLVLAGILAVVVAGGSRERRCQRPSNDALANDALAISAATMALEALALVVAGGSPASAESAGHGLGNPWPRPHREGTAGPGTAPAKAERLDVVRDWRVARQRRCQRPSNDVGWAPARRAPSHGLPVG